MPKTAKVAGFFQGHFIRFWGRGQAGNEVSERVGQLGGARRPKCLSELDKLYGVCKYAGNNADWPPSRWAGMFSGRSFRNRWGIPIREVGHTLDQRLGAVSGFDPIEAPDSLWASTRRLGRSGASPHQVIAAPTR